MLWVTETLGAVQTYIDLGGGVIYMIAALAFLMWILVVERLMYYYGGGMRKDVNNAIDAWEARDERKSWHAHKVRDKLISEVSDKIATFLPMIKTTVALAPLFGLLGTVTGMINVFEIMAITGGGDARQMASGVFSATVPTLSGMVVAIFGVFADTWVTRIATKETALMEDHLTMDH